MILQVAMETPFRGVFEYRPPTSLASHGVPPVGVRVRVPFGRQQLIGVLVGIASESAVAAPKLKAALEILDEHCIVDPVTFDLLRWASEYYHHPIGEVFAAALPVSLRAGQPALQKIEWWCLSDAGRRELSAPSARRAPQQRALLAWLGARGCATSDDIGEEFKPAQLRSLATRGWIVEAAAPATAAMEMRPSEVTLTLPQAACGAAIIASLS